MGREDWRSVEEIEMKIMILLVDWCLGSQHLIGHPIKLSQSIFLCLIDNY